MKRDGWVGNVGLPVRCFISIRLFPLDTSLVSISVPRLLDLSLVALAIPKIIVSCSK